MADRVTAHLADSPDAAAQEAVLPEIGVCERVLFESSRDARGRRLILHGSLDLRSAWTLGTTLLADAVDSGLPLTLDLAGLFEAEPAAIRSLMRRQQLAAVAGVALNLRIASHQVEALLEAGRRAPAG